MKTKNYAMKKAKNEWIVKNGNQDWRVEKSGFGG